MIILQHDWHEAFKQGESAWVTYKDGEKLIHGRVTKNHSKEFQIEKKDTKLIISHEKTKTTFVPPTTKYDVDSFTYRYLDVSPNETLFVKNGESKVEIFDVDRHEIRRSVEMITTPDLVRFFPSGKVLLIGDYNQLKVVDCATGTVARTLTGHSGQINDVDFIGPGRNLVSYSTDGTVKLWEMSTGQMIENILDGGHGSVNTGCIVKGGETDKAEHDMFYGMGNEFCWIGTETGKIIGKRLFGEITFTEQLDSAINTMCYIDQKLFAGTQNGTLYRIVTNDYKIFAVKCKSIGSAIVSMVIHNDQIFIGHTDGRLVSYSFDLERNELELSCADCDPIFHLHSRNNTIYASSRDGILRCYTL